MLSNGRHCGKYSRNTRAHRASCSAYTQSTSKQSQTSELTAIPCAVCTYAGVRDAADAVLLTGDGVTACSVDIVSPRHEGCRIASPSIDDYPLGAAVFAATTGCAAEAAGAIASVIMSAIWLSTHQTHAHTRAHTHIHTKSERLAERLAVCFLTM